MYQGFVRIALLIRKPIGQECLIDLIDAKGPHAIAFVVTDFRDSAGWWGKTSIKEICEKNKISCFDSNIHRDLGFLVDKFNPSHLISIQYDRKISQEVLDKVNGEAYNLHLAPLPQYQGWHGASHAILNGDSFFAATAHKMTAEFDFGAIVSQPTFPISSMQTVGEVYLESEKAGLLAFSDLVDSIYSQVDCQTEALTEMDPSKRRYYSQNELNIRLQKSDIKLAERASDFSFRLNNQLGEL